MALASIGRLVEGVRRVDRLFETVSKLQAGQEALTDRLVAIERRLAALETREDLLVEKMATRASEAATSVMNANLVDMARRLGALEERSRIMGEGRKQVE